MVPHVSGLPDVPPFVGEHHREDGAQTPAEEATRRRPVPGAAQVEAVGVNQPFGWINSPR